MKKAVITGLAICLALFLCCCAVDEPMEPEHAPIAGLSDISGTEYESEILYWFDRGVITGYPDGTFLPDRPITRSEAAKLICSVSGLSLKSEILIADVSHDSWCYDAAAASTVHGIMKLYGDGTFQPHRTITRQEAMVILCRASGISSDSPEPALESIEDAEDIKSWARESVAALLERSIISPDAAGRVRPTGAMSRGEFAAILARIDETLEWASPSAVFDASYVSWISDADPGAAVKPQAVAGEYWLFLPSSADRHSTSLVISDILSDAEITFSGNKASSSSMPFDVTELADPENSGEYFITVSVSDGSSSVSLDYRLLFSERVSSVFLSSSEPDTAGRSFVGLPTPHSVWQMSAITEYISCSSTDNYTAVETCRSSSCRSNITKLNVCQSYITSSKSIGINLKCTCTCECCLTKCYFSQQWVVIESIRLYNNRMIVLYSNNVVFSNITKLNVSQSSTVRECVHTNGEIISTSIITLQVNGLKVKSCNTSILESIITDFDNTILISIISISINTCEGQLVQRCNIGECSFDSCTICKLLETYAVKSCNTNKCIILNSTTEIVIEGNHLQSSLIGSFVVCIIDISNTIQVVVS